MSDWCEGAGKIVKIEKMTNEQIDNTAWISFCLGRPSGVKRIKLRCPVCRRRLTASVQATMDADILHRVPRHKSKGWNRKKKSPGRKSQGRRMR